MGRRASISRKTKETEINIGFDLDGSGKVDISTGIPFFDHMLTAFAVHGFFDLEIRAKGDLEVDFHHTVEDIGLVLGQALSKALENKKSIVRFGDYCVPMDEALSRVTIDVSNRPYLVYNFPSDLKVKGSFDTYIAKEFFQAFCVQGAINLHINSYYGDNEHHVLESIFKALGKSLHRATRMNENIQDVLSSKGSL
ncbi:MAG: imidazoleglycerol-phosphate dehydratase HisB [Desulfobacula sp.]|jgi:imidazoleglycerol-phosphate dehydratase|uniref:imidazoleglycerol-phosphate dehydratase HisB n=1 Tax=Desulfobacula sp. TaxID=2593537 RepID=UPI001DE6E26A|nr:imidazoleglycerol-phosphate dehydratase HisB [Desulfobacula sp.]MBT3485425.1 imidazoleglycerol-phosphate dehydratase HisB [Desulfobacula sp.]MBT3805568.1 imidazoleglycerol-phosphate dehydratase HisB [Desulfobacula sp.]MBT4026064.1 imidazoleglycerol-phosphate dehydratase HisB [Desulfobacula sp.]MBT4199988.1 imidazoleglycerol-phosphate dehydratase HisB [Desulfobacula sp.]